MNFNKFTSKAAEAVQTAQQLTQQYKHNAIDVLHLFLAMLEQKEGFIPAIIKKIEASSQQTIANNIKNDTINAL
jgi:ATP-dependent Clp protease ATP-binding subunit ClpA